MALRDHSGQKLDGRNQSPAARGGDCGCGERVETRSLALEPADHPGRGEPQRQQRQGTGDDPSRECCVAPPQTFLPATILKPDKAAITGDQDGYGPRRRADNPQPKESTEKVHRDHPCKKCAAATHAVRRGSPLAAAKKLIDAANRRRSAVSARRELAIIWLGLSSGCHRQRIPPCSSTSSAKEDNKMSACTARRRRAQAKLLPKSLRVRQMNPVRGKPLPMSPAFTKKAKTAQRRE